MVAHRRSSPGRFPDWLRKRVPAAGNWGHVSAVLRRLDVDTVCRGAQCPNLMDCFARGRATFLLMGPRCSRRCSFCAVESGAPAPLRPDEPQRVAEAARALGLTHVVLTSVTRDDLPDGGASHLAAAIRALRCVAAGPTVEVLVPDFGGSREALETVLCERPEVLNHNVETVPRLYVEVRPGADYQRSLDILRWAAEHGVPLVKSGLMVGLGESESEVQAVLGDLWRVGCRAVTIGQYLAPSERHHPVVRFVNPEQFARYADAARATGFDRVASGPFVRSSYGAEEMFSGGGC